MARVVRRAPNRRVVLRQDGVVWRCWFSVARNETTVARRLGEVSGTSVIADIALGVVTVRPAAGRIIDEADETSGPLLATLGGRG